MTARPRLLIIDDDASFARAMRRSFERRGYEVATCGQMEEIEQAIDQFKPAFAIVDLKLADSSGLPCVQLLVRRLPGVRVVVLTGFASITTAVESIKLGACHYLTKPANADDIDRAFGRGAGDVDTPLPSRPTSLKSLEWERIHEMLIETNFNLSEAARRLGLHRRTLARKLAKRPIP
ncbi:MAG: response regulator transcription factor [Proteobacteria bacterium]|nr:response regulator transcription factor [Pseudomonadota bacterium]